MIVAFGIDEQSGRMWLGKILVIWVDTSERLPLESAESFNIDKYII
jgi:hypothetical protein